MTHEHNDFEHFMAELLPTNADLAFYTDFDKCYANVSKIAVKLCQLDYLLGKSDLEQAVRDLWQENSSSFDVLGILIATRDSDRKMVINDRGDVRLITDYFTTVDGVIDFIRETGLGDIFSNKQITRLTDYVLGVEVGLDTNARKNRSGHIMERRVADRLRKAGIEFRREVCSSELPGISDALGKDTKRFDFVIETDVRNYLVEVNFYSSGGSKLNEVARAYQELAPLINHVAGYEFVWITDGIGWESARGKLEEAFHTIPHVYNLTTLDRFISLINS